MLEMTRLNEINIDMFKNTINNALINNIFIKKNIQSDIPDLNVEDQLSVINALVFNPEYNYILIKTLNNIEWTPIKLYQKAYYIVKMNGSIWLISHTSHEGFIIKYNIQLIDYIKYLMNYIKTIDYINYLDENKWAFPNELSNAFLQLIQNNLTKPNAHIFIKKTIYYNSSLKINHYMCKIDNAIYYFPIGNNKLFKPIYYGTVKCLI
jgi:hypothetical protein